MGMLTVWMSTNVQVIADRLSNNRILGIHFTGPHAGEVMQGYAVAMRSVINLHKRRLVKVIF